MNHLTFEQEGYCRQELITTAIELMVADEMGIASEELAHHYWL